MTFSQLLLSDFPMALHHPRAPHGLVVNGDANPSTSHLVLTTDVLARPRVVFHSAELAKAAPTILVWFHALREGAARLPPNDAALFESRTNFPRVAGISDLRGALAAMTPEQRRDIVERILSSAPLLRRLVDELTDTLSMEVVATIWSHAIERLNTCLDVDLRADLAPEPYLPVPISDLGASNRESSREAMEVVHRLHRAGFGGAKLWCLVASGLGAWRNRLFAGPFPVRGSLPSGISAHTITDRYADDLFGSLASSLESEPDRAWRTPDHPYTSWFARTLERTAPMGVIEMPTAYRALTTEGVELEPPWWPLPTPASCVHWPKGSDRPPRAPVGTHLDRVVRALVRLGRDPVVLGTGTVPTLDGVLAMSSYPNKGWKYWEDFAAKLTEQDLAALMRGLVTAGNAGMGGMGSVSPVVPLHRVFRERFPASERELSLWIIRYRTNEYEPFGTVDTQATTWAEVVARRKQEEADQERRERDAKAAKVVRLARESTEQLWNAVRRGDVKAVTLMLGRGADWEAVCREHGSLLELARAHGRLEMVALLDRHGVQ